MANSKLLLRIFMASSMVFVMAGLFSSQAGWAANNCVTQQGGMGGTGAATHDGGIGGTGSMALREGISGTGDMAQGSGIGGTGIVGIITGFASICVNGMEIHYDPETPLEINGRPATAKDLAVGQLVLAEATGNGDEVAARNISVQYAVSGPISRVSAANGQMQIMGQEVQMIEHTINPSGSNTANLHAGDFVQVSGLRKQDGVIVAARIDRVPAQNEVSVNGPVSQVSNHEFSVYGLRIAPAFGNVPEGVAAGREVRVFGQLQHGLLKAEKIDVAPAVPFGGSEQRLELQGYLHASRAADKLIVGQTPMEISPQTVIGSKLAPDQLVRVSARFTPDKRLVVEHIEVTRDYFQRGELRNMSRESTGQAAKNAERKDSGDMRGENRSGEAKESSERDHRVRPEGGEPSEKSENNTHPDGVEYLERINRNEQMERSERVELPERTERIERVELPERVERIERVELPEMH